ncbi:MAG: YraN family protein [Betaproteobacteria bacterium]|nr:YraN family protein [Betaproteobacteria bacterium]
MNAHGRDAEDLALAHLSSRGLVLRARNYRCRFGEIDLVMTDGATLVFVEVRRRTNPRFATAAESITQQKRSRLIATAGHYLAQARVDSPCRFDAVLVDRDGRIDWIRDAFGA